MKTSRGTIVSGMALALIVILLAGALRLHLLGAQSLWNDEGNAYVQATRTVSAIAENAAADIHPPGYYALLALWRVLTGETEFALRSLSAFASILSVALTFALGKRLYGIVAGLSAALFVTLNTFSLYYAQEARMYALLALWGIAAMWAFIGFMQAPDAPRRIRWAIALALLNAAGLWTHYAYPAVMAAQGVLFVLWWVTEILASPQLRFLNTKQPVDSQSASTDNQIKDGGHLPLAMRARGAGGEGVLSLLLVYILANLATILLFLPWLPTALRQITTWPSTGTPIALTEAFNTIGGWFALGITYNVDVPQQGITVYAAFFLLFGLLCFPYQDAGKRYPGRTWWRMVVPVIWIAVTLGGFFLLGLFRPANLKFLLPAQIAFALWMGRGVWVLWTLRPRRTATIFQYAPKLAAGVGAFALALVQVDGLQALYHAPQFQRDDYRGIVQLIRSENLPSEAVIVNAPGQIEAFNYYYHRRRDIFPLPIGLTVDAAATEEAVLDILNDYERVYAVLWGTDERDPQRVVENTLNREAFPIDSQWFGNVRLLRYAAWVGEIAMDDPDATFVDVSQDGNIRDAIELVDFTLNDTSLRPGDPLMLTAYWRTESPLPVPYKIFVQLLDENGVLVAQRDSEPVNGSNPTNTWRPGQIIEDHHALIIPDGLTQVNLSLIIGFYNPSDAARRLSVMISDEISGDHLNLTDIHVTADEGN